MSSLRWRSDAQVPVLGCPTGTGLLLGTLSGPLARLDPERTHYAGRSHGVAGNVAFQRAFERSSRIFILFVERRGRRVRLRETLVAQD
jgi:hypothetical protein